jgi:hypothetical protein
MAAGLTMDEVPCENHERRKRPNMIKRKVMLARRRSHSGSGGYTARPEAQQ